MERKETAPKSARERILDTAGQLFARDGFLAVGIDLIIAESGVAKMTLYRHFSSKEELIVAYLERANLGFWHWMDSMLADVAGPQAKILAMFQAVQKVATSPQCLGCSFQSAALEFPVLDHAVHQVAIKHKDMVLQRIRSLASEAGLKEPEALANQLLLLMDGAWTAVRMYGPQNAAVDLVPAVKILLAAHQ
ncbi:MAG TPA: TetR/AcrR family transcriptional regulator [Symbiobacteriaceae bacterium]|nr:TetR/AcrR family transcriptional regulator [Symbiobacteriaceae bacterium]